MLQYRYNVPKKAFGILKTKKQKKRQLSHKIKIKNEFSGTKKE